MKKELTHGSLFSGVGGFELGAQMSNIDTLWNCEIDERKRNILKKHFPNVKQYADVCTASGLDYVDIISGGFPCQDISICNNTKKSKDENGNKKGITGERSGLWREYNRIIREVRPKYIIFENSPMLISRGLEYVLSDLSQSGYHCEWQCLSAAQFGFNHRRMRIYGIAYSDQIRCKFGSQIFRKLQEALPKQETRHCVIPMPLKRFDSKSDYDNVRMDDGFSRELDKNRIEDMGNAVIPLIAHYLFECIKYFDSNIK